jgi:chemotaxis protein CheD
MSSPSVADPLAVTFVGMGEAAIAQQSGRLMAVLGSCVGVTLYHPRLQLGMLCHVVLPEFYNPTDQPSKFADSAIPWMVGKMSERGALPSQLVAKIVGGACMFSQAGPMQIGGENIRAVLEALESVPIPVIARDVGGNCGRRICFDVATGDIAIESAGAIVKVM